MALEQNGVSKRNSESDDSQILPFPQLANTGTTFTSTNATAASTPLIPTSIIIASHSTKSSETKANISSISDVAESSVTRPRSSFSISASTSSTPVPKRCLPQKVATLKKMKMLKKSPKSILVGRDSIALQKATLDALRRQNELLESLLNTAMDQRNIMKDVRDEVMKRKEALP